ncbi:uncharacterized protein LOC135840352 [Planococcus citri]|uniref:uncharacterized protein LOC135840352 n=1 Tax=Planococcus citri TaxID=170843 RepID=UPI0031F77D60
MDSQRRQCLQKEILSELKLRGKKTWDITPKTPDETNSRIDFKLPSAPSSVRSPANLREPVIEKEIVEEVDKINLPEYEASDILQLVTHDLKTVFEACEIPVNEWDLYGSFKNGLRCHDSDIDYYNGSYENRANCEPAKVVKKVWEVFRDDTYFESKRYFERARVPLVELIHKRTGKVCSITFSGKMGVYDSLLAKRYLGQYPNLKVLTLFLKHVLKSHELHGTGKLTTHVIFWLLVFFLQQKKLLLPVKDLRQAAVQEKNYVRDWNYSVPDCYPIWRQAECSSEESIVSLYRGFLEFYKNFNFLKYVISPYFGYAIPIENIETLDIPSDAYIGQKYPNVNGDGFHLFARSSMNIQDVSTLTMNLAANVSLKAVNKFRVVCENLLYALHEGHPLKISPESELKSTKLLPKSINQTAEFELDFKSLESRIGDLKEYLIAAVSNLMVTVLEFQCDKVMAHDVTVVHHKQGDPVLRKVPVLSFDYSTTYGTLSNKYVLYMFEESSSCLRENFGVFFFFEIRNDLERVKVSVEGDGRFVEYMQTKGKELLVAQISLDGCVITQV